MASVRVSAADAAPASEEGATSGEMGVCSRKVTRRSVQFSSHMPECSVMIFVRPTCRRRARASGQLLHTMLSHSASLSMSP